MYHYLALVWDPRNPRHSLAANALANTTHPTMRIPPDVGRQFRRMPAPDSAPCRPGIPRHVGPLC
jgi:hypothetical protein